MGTRKKSTDIYIEDVQSSSSLHTNKELKQKLIPQFSCNISLLSKQMNNFFLLISDLS